MSFILTPIYKTKCDNYLRSVASFAKYDVLLLHPIYSKWQNYFPLHLWLNNTLACVSVSLCVCVCMCMFVCDVCVCVSCIVFTISSGHGHHVWFLILGVMSSVIDMVAHLSPWYVTSSNGMVGSYSKSFSSFKKPILIYSPTNSV